MSAKSDTKEAAAVYLFTGEVDARRARDVRALTQTADADFDLEVMDAQIRSAEEILSAVTTVPFASDRKTVVVENIDRMDTGDQERIADFVPRLGERSRLILLTSERSATAGKPSARGTKKEPSPDEGEDGDKRRGLSPKLRSAVKEHGLVTSYGKPKARDLVLAAVAHARKHGRKLDERAAEKLAWSTNENLSVLEKEIEKLVIYTEGRDVITLGDVENLVPASPEDRIFDIVDAVAARRADTAVRMLDETLAASAKPDEEVMRIVSMLARHFRMMYQLVYLRTEAGVTDFGSLPEELSALLPKEHNAITQHQYAKGKMIGQSRLFTLPQIRTALKRILACELAVKGVESGTGLRRLNLEMLIVRLCDR